MGSILASFESWGGVLFVFLDTNILIYAFEAGPEVRGRVLRRLAGLHDGGDRIVVSDLVRLECLVGPLKARNQALIDGYRGFFSLPSVRVLALSGDVCDRAAEYRARHGFRTPDALNLAAAVVSGCEIFLTHDMRLARFPDLKVESLP